MIHLDISKSDRYNLSKVPFKSAAIRESFLVGCAPYEIHIFGEKGKSVYIDSAKFEDGFYVYDQLTSNVKDKPVSLKLCMFVVNADWHIAQRKDGEFLYFYDCDNVVDGSQPFYDFVMSGTALMGYDVFGDKINSEVQFMSKSGENKKVPFYVFTSPYPVGYYIYRSSVVVIYSLFVNLPREKVASNLSEGFTLLNPKEKGYEFANLKDRAYTAVIDEFFENEHDMGLS